MTHYGQLAARNWPELIPKVFHPAGVSNQSSSRDLTAAPKQFAAFIRIIPHRTKHYRQREISD
jgi:hypothetical protein